MTTWFSRLLIVVALVAVGCSDSSTKNTPAPVNPLPTPGPINPGSGPYDGRIPTEYLNRTAALFLTGDTNNDPNTARLSDFMFPYALEGSLLSDVQVAVLTNANPGLATVTQLRSKFFLWLEDDLGGWYAEIPSITNMSYRQGTVINAIYSDKWMTVKVIADKCVLDSTKLCGQVYFRARAQNLPLVVNNNVPVANPSETQCLTAGTAALQSACTTYMNSSTHLGNFGNDPRGIADWTQISPVTRTRAQWETLP